MPPKSTATKAKAAAPADHTSYQDMIKDAIINLKDRSGSSRSALKKYVKANNKGLKAEDTKFDSLFNRALRTGVEKGIFEQPKGASGGTKLAKKEATKPAVAKAPKTEKKVATKPVAKKATTTKKTVAKPAAKKTAATKKTAAKPKAAPKAKAVAKPKAKKAAPPKSAPAIVEKPTVLSKTKSGRVTKTTAPVKKGTPKKAAPKKAAAKKSTPKKSTPKKA